MSPKTAKITQARTPREVARSVLRIEAAAIENLLPQLNASFDRAVDILRQCRGRVVCTGMGKSGIILRKIAATLSSTGTPSLFLHPAEAIHGDLGMVVADDVVLAASYSGSTEELLRLVELVKRLGAPLVVMTGKEDSPLAQHADVFLPVMIDQEACPLQLAPTASTTATLALGDALAMALLETRGFTSEDFARLHPGGQLGKKLLKVRELMRQGSDLPQVPAQASIREAISEISRTGAGITAIVDAEGHLLGCYTDGDLRRLLVQGAPSMDQPASELMQRKPKTIQADEVAAAALHLLEEHRITALFVCDDKGKVEGIVHLHDLWRLELF